MPESYGGRTIDEFLSAVASETASPAGGTAAATAGAIGTALCEMVCTHTIGEDQTDAVNEELLDVREELGSHRATLLELAARDAAVVDELFGGSNDGPEPADAKRAAGVPLATAEACLSVLELAPVVMAAGNRSAVADGATGVMLVHAALRAAVFIVRSNLDGLPGEAAVEEMDRRTTDLERSAGRALDEVWAAAGMDGWPAGNRPMDGDSGR